MRSSCVNHRWKNPALSVIPLALQLVFCATAVAQVTTDTDNLNETSWQQAAKDENIRSFVLIKAYKRIGESEVAAGGGTGFIISSQGYVITARHVVPPDFSRLEGKIGGVPYPVTKADEVSDHDIVLLKLPPPEESQFYTAWPSVQRINPDSPIEAIVAWGFADGLVGLQRADGKIIKRDAPDHPGHWLANAPVNEGMSGGPVFDRSGAIVAIVQGAFPSLNQTYEFVPIRFARRLLNDYASPTVTRSNATVQGIAKKLSRAEREIEELIKDDKLTDLSEDEKSHFFDLIQKARDTIANGQKLKDNYVKLNQSNPYPEKRDARQELVNGLKTVANESNTALSQVKSIVPGAN